MGPKLIKSEYYACYDVTLHTYDRRTNMCGHFGSRFEADFNGLRWDPFNYGKKYHARELTERGVRNPEAFLEAITGLANERLTKLDDLQKVYDTLENYSNMARRIDEDEAGEWHLVQRGLKTLKGVIEYYKAKELPR